MYIHREIGFPLRSGSASVQIFKRYEPERRRFAPVPRFHHFSTRQRSTTADPPCPSCHKTRDTVVRAGGRDPIGSRDLEGRARAREREGAVKRRGKSVRLVVIYCFLFFHFSFLRSRVRESLEIGSRALGTLRRRDRRRAIERRALGGLCFGGSRAIGESF